MKFSEDSTQAATYLRQAVPTMVKYKIVPNPLNYALWYSYFSEQFPRLNEELDHAIERFGTCPPEIGESLFLQNFSQIDEKNEKKLDVVQRAFSQVVAKLSNSIADTAQKTTDFSAALKQNLSHLENVEVDESLRLVVSELSASANAIYSNSENFREKLASAQDEINVLKTELKRARQEANTDPLTSLCNRRVFEAIYHEFVSSSSEQDTLSLIIMDIDKFKAFNDTHGHLIGDQILKYVGKILQEECPENITPVRFGGEEFALLCPQYNTDKATAFAEKIRSKLAATPFSNRKTGERIPPVTASFGVTTKQPDDILSQVIERADKALYAAKNAGRNTVRFA